MIEAITVLKIVVGLLGAICTALAAVVVWVIRITQWKTGVDYTIKVIVDAAPVSSAECLSHRTALEDRRASCQKHYDSELGHGESRFDKLDKKIDDKDIEDEARYQGVLSKIDDVMKLVVS